MTKTEPSRDAARVAGGAKPGRRRAAAIRAPLSMAALAACAGVTALGAQTAPIRVEQIRADPLAHVNEVRTVEGVVDRLVNRAGSTGPSFYLEDDYGHQILVIPYEAPPARGERVTVTGVVTLDPSGDPVITMFDPGAVAGARPGQPAPAAPPPPGALPTPPPSVGRSGPFGFSRTSLLLATLAGVALVGITGLAVRRRRMAAVGATGLGVSFGRHRDVDVATSELWPPSEREFDGRTLRFSRPEPTAQLLPARLDVIGGADAGEAIRFAGVIGEPIAVMFGRAPGEGPSYVQLKQKTVSRTHAIIRHRNDGWWIENLSTTNPTVLNDEVLGVKEMVLSHGDRIEMGEVTFRFRAS